MRVQLPEPPILWSLSAASEVSVFLLTTAPPVGHELPSLLLSLAHPRRPHPTLCYDYFLAFFFHLRNINFMSPTFRTKTGLQQKLNKGRMKKKNVFINIYFYQLFMIYKALAT